jgi:WD40 repeat protein
VWDLENVRFVARLDGAKDQVFSARFLRGDREILTVGGDGVPRRWEVETGRLLKAYLGVSGSLLSVALDRDDAMFVTAGIDGMLRFWDTDSGAMLWVFQAHRSPVIGIHVEGRDILTRGHTGEVSRWEFPKQVSPVIIDQLVRCLPQRFDEATGGLVDQAPCERK